MNFPMEPLPNDWHHLLADQLQQPYFAALMAFVAEERAQYQVFPKEQNVFRAFQLTRYREVKVVILGQDPYPNEGQAHGLCFSVPNGVSFPPSLRNIFKELHADLGVPIPKNGSLEAWARQGVLLLNTILTVRAGHPLSHQGHGWETFTDAVIQAINQNSEHVVFVLWGKSAQRKATLISQLPHTIIHGAHPSPLSAHAGFLGSRPFSQINQALKDHHQPEIHWELS